MSVHRKNVSIDGQTGYNMSLCRLLDCKHCLKQNYLNKKPATNLIDLFDVAQLYKLYKQLLMVI